MNVAVGIVLYKSERHVARALDALAAQTLRPAQVICVDNCFPDGAAAVAESHALRPMIIRNAGNVGFARAQNQAIRASSGEYYMALNPDVFLGPDYIERVVAELEAEPTAGWAQGKLLFTSESDRGPDRIYSAGHVMRPDYFAFNRGYGEADDGRFDAREMIFGANGAAAVYRRQMLDGVAVRGEFYDELFFLYWDDVDLDVRANAAGWHCLFVPRATGRHVGAASLGPSTERVKVENRKNRYLSLLKNRGACGLLRAWSAGFPKNAWLFALDAVFSPRIWFAAFAGVLRDLGKALAKGRSARRRLAERGPR